MKIYGAPQKMKKPIHARITRIVIGESEIRMGNKPATKAAVTRRAPSAHMAVKNQHMATASAAIETMRLLGLLDGKGPVTVIIDRSSPGPV
jgi:hypothetical protein